MAIPPLKHTSSRLTLRALIYIKEMIGRPFTGTGLAQNRCIGIWLPARRGNAVPGRCASAAAVHDTPAGLIQIMLLAVAGV